MSDRRPRETPESEEFQRFKGKRIRVLEMSGRQVDGRLVWVDVFTFGQEQEGRVEMVYKQGVMRIIPLE